MATARITAGIFLFAAAVCLIGRADDTISAIVMVLGAAVLGVGAGLLLYPYIIAPFSEAFARLVCPDAVGEVREEFSKARALMAAARYEEAAAELERMLAERPELLEGTVLLANLLYEHLDQADAALARAQAALTAAEWHDEHERLAMLVTDILLDQGCRDEAAAALQQSATRAGCTGAARRLQERLRHLS